MNRLRSLTVLLCAAVLASCEKNAVQDITGPVPAARIKFFNFAVATGTTPSVNFYANDRKMTAVLSGTGAELTTGVAFGGVGAGGLYTGIEPGAYTLTGRISATVDKDLVIATAPATIEAGKFYSFFMSGFYNTTTKTAEAFVIEDPIPTAIDYAAAQVRFVNAISNSSPMTLSATNTTAGSAALAVGGLVAYKSAGAFTALPAGTYNLATRTAGGTTDVITRTGVSFVGGRVYTIGARGDITVTTATTNRPFLDNTANR